MATPTTNLPMSTHQAFFRQEFKHLLAPLDMYYVIKLERQNLMGGEEIKTLADAIASQPAMQTIWHIHIVCLA